MADLRCFLGIEKFPSPEPRPTSTYLDCQVGRCWPRFRGRELFNPKKTTEVRHEGAGLQGPRQEELGRGSESRNPAAERCHRQDAGYVDLRHRSAHPEG